MSEFKSQQTQSGSNLALAFTGVIDEDVEFPQVTPPEGELHIDLQNVSSINSVGIREWLNWITPLAEKSKVILMNAPKALVFQFNMVEGFLPKNAKVNSFYVPYFCETCDQEYNVLFNVGKEVEVSAGQYKINYDVKAANLCKGADCEIEMDASEGKYFQFLKKMT
jgi:hypothetical protein